MPRRRVAGPKGRRGGLQRTQASGCAARKIAKVRARSRAACMEATLRRQAHKANRRFQVEAGQTAKSGLLSNERHKRRATVHWHNDFDLPKRFAAFMPPIVTEVAVAAILVLLTIGARLTVQYFLWRCGRVRPGVSPPSPGRSCWRAGARAPWSSSPVSCWPGTSCSRSSTVSRSRRRRRRRAWFLTTLAECLLLWFVAGYRTALQTTIDLQAKRTEALGRPTGDPERPG